MQSKKTKLFIEKARTMHGDCYDYSLVEYVGSHGKVKILCQEHGVFEQLARVHLRGHRCPRCSHGSGKKTTQEFVSDAKLIHGAEFDYSLTDYVSAHEPVVILCKTHGRFKQLPNSHLKGFGCAKCSRTHSYSTAEWVELAQKVHGNKYRYGHSEYLGASSKIKIECTSHGIFEQFAKNHISGSGCVNCHFDRSQAHSIYLLNDGGVVKIGISIDPARRVRDLNNKNGSHAEIRRLWSLPNFDVAYALEQRIHKRLAHLNAGYRGFDGATEWFEVSPAVAIKEITSVVSNSQQLALI